MKDWYKVRDSRAEKPSVLDDSSSTSTVYERRSIRQEPTTAGMGEQSVTIMEWVYEQREFTREEYAQMQAPATKSMMQAISGIELSVAML